MSLEAHTPRYTVHVIGWERVDADTTETQHRDDRHAHQPQVGGRGGPQSLTGPYPTAYPIPGSLSNLHGVSPVWATWPVVVRVVLPGWQLNVNVNVNSSIGDRVLTDQSQGEGLDSCVNPFFSRSRRTFMQHIQATWHSRRASGQGTGVLPEQQVTSYSHFSIVHSALH